MQRNVTMMVVAGALWLAAAPAAAQEKGNVGITMGFPASVGLLWHATEKIAVRPEFSFSTSSSDAATIDIDGLAFGTGISALFYVQKWDNLSTYVSPRYTFSRSETTAEGVFGDRTTTSRTHLFSGSFGAQYFLGERFTIFGEVGLAYSHSGGETEDTIFDSNPSATSFSTRSAVGVAFYF